MDFAGALFAVGHKRFEFRALGLCKVYFPATRWHTPSWWSEYTKILQLSKDLLEKPLRTPNKTRNRQQGRISWVPAYAGTTDFLSFPRKRESRRWAVLLGILRSANAV